MNVGMKAWASLHPYSSPLFQQGRLLAPATNYSTRFDSDSGLDSSSVRNRSVLTWILALPDLGFLADGPLNLLCQSRSSVFLLGRRRPRRCVVITAGLANLSMFDS
jgi:hypothetical protein